MASRAIVSSIKRGLRDHMLTVEAIMCSIMLLMLGCAWVVH